MAKIHGLLDKFKKLDPQYKLNAPSSTERGELDVLKDVNGYITKIGSPIDIKIGTKVYKGIYGANKVSGTPKGDIALVAHDGRKFVDKVYISHKMGRDASGFQQYSGITPKADGKVRGAISQDKNVLEFLEDISKMHNTIVKKKQRYHRIIKDPKLVGKAIFGPEYGRREYTEDNIHLLGQGKAILRPQGSAHLLFFSADIHLNPNVNEFMKPGNGFTAILGARYSSGRNYEVKGKTYAGVRVLIMPQKLIGGNSIEI